MEATAPALDRPLPFYDRWFVSLINDPRDLPFVHLIIQCAAVALMGVGLFFVPDAYFWYAAPAYLVIWVAGVMDRYILMLHCTSHRILFRHEYKRLNHIVPWMLGPFMGETPETYFTHHMGMHHPENNMEEDLSSTIRFQRDRFTHWFRYFARFITIGIIELPIYHYKRGHGRMAWRTLLGEGAFWTLAGLSALVSWKAALVVFVGPVLFVRLMMMIGNWGQHAFVDPNDPENPYRNSITCINIRYNRRCFNDGYHIHHHVKARCHWSEYPQEFEDNKAHYGQQDAVVFDGIDFFQVWVFLMLGAYKSLARRFVRLPGAPERTEEEVVAFLKSRMVPIKTA